MPGCPLSPQRGVTRADVVTDAVLDAACAWLCQPRRDWLAVAEVWRWRHRWSEPGEARLSLRIAPGESRPAMATRGDRGQSTRKLSA